MDIPHLVFNNENWAIAPLLALGVANLALGLGKSIFAGKKLSDLHKQPLAQYSETPEQKASRLRANEFAQAGFSPEEKAAYQQQLSRSQNTGYQEAVKRAPNMSQQILSGINYTNIGAQNDFASRDASLHRKNIEYSDRFSNYLQELNNKNIAVQQQQRLMAEQALGLGVQSGIMQGESGILQGVLGLAGGDTATGSTSALLNPNQNLYGYNAAYNNKDIVDNNLLSNNNV